MEENEKLVQATKTYRTFCDMMDSRGWKYDGEQEEMLIITRVKGDDFPIDVRIFVDADRLLVRLHSLLAFEMAPERIPDLALAVCAINDNLVDGNFDLNIENGRIIYRMTTSFRESLLSEAAFDFFLGFAVHVVDRYSIKLFMVAKELLTPNQLLEEIRNS